jgi:hypothetical protein
MAGKHESDTTRNGSHGQGEHSTDQEGGSLRGQPIIGTPAPQTPGREENPDGAGNPWS